MKLFSTVLSSLILLITTFSAYSNETLTIAATPVPHAEILNYIKPQLEKENITIEVKEFTDYIQPNIQVAEKNIDANFFQHEPYLNDFNKSKNTNLIKVLGVHIEPLGIYSEQIDSIEQIAENATVTIPNDPTNGGRALLLLQKAGLIKLKNETSINSTVKDIIYNPKKLKIKELEAATIPRVLSQVEIAIINTNYALEANLNPTKDALFIEGNDSPYVNILVTRPDNKESQSLKKLVQILQSDDVKNFINTRYQGSIVPVF